jgi:hypothetical protein
MPTSNSDHRRYEKRRAQMLGKTVLCKNEVSHDQDTVSTRYFQLHRACLPVAKRSEEFEWSSRGYVFNRRRAPLRAKLVEIDPNGIIVEMACCGERIQLERRDAGSPAYKSIREHLGQGLQDYLYGDGEEMPEFV